MAPSLRLQLENAAQSDLQPNFLLLIDLTDDQYKVQDKEQLTDYAFHLLQENDLVKTGTVICYSTFAVAELATKKVVSTAICCSHDGTSEDLSQIQSKRSEFSETFFL
jgi:hypothetical protein